MQILTTFILFCSIEHINDHLNFNVFYDPLHGLTFMWLGCYGLCLRHKPTKLAHSLYSVLVAVSVFMALSTVFHSINSPNNSLLSHSVPLVLFLPYRSFQLYLFMEVSLSCDKVLCGCLGLKHQLTNKLISGSDIHVYVII